MFTDNKSAPAVASSPAKVETKPVEIPAREPLADPAKNDVDPIESNARARFAKCSGAISLESCRVVARVQAAHDRGELGKPLRS